MEITPAADRAASPGNPDWFTGTVSHVRLLSADNPSRLTAAEVTFEPGARTAWHTHPAGQLLVVTAGEGWACTQDGDRRTIRPGDTVWFAPGERHWHGATDRTAMTHVALQEAVDGTAVDWAEQVSDADYAG